MRTALESLISLRCDGKDPRRVFQVRPSREQSKYHGDEHDPPPDLVNDSLLSFRTGFADQEYKDGEALGDHPEARHGELPDDHDGGHPGWHGALPHEREEQRDDQGLVGDGVHELAESRYLVVATGHYTVEVVGHDRANVQHYGRVTC